MNAALLSLIIAAAAPVTPPAGSVTPLAGGAKRISLVLDQQVLTDRPSKVMPTVYRSGLIDRVRDLSGKRLPDA